MYRIASYLSVSFDLKAIVWYRDNFIYFFVTSHKFSVSICYNYLFTVLYLFQEYSRESLCSLTYKSVCLFTIVLKMTYVFIIFLCFCLTANCTCLGHTNFLYFNAFTFEPNVFSFIFVNYHS